MMLTTKNTKNVFYDVKWEYFGITDIIFFVVSGF